MDDLIFSYADPSDRPVKRHFIRLIERATGQRQLKLIYLDNRQHPAIGESFFAAAVRRLAINVQYDVGRLARIPKTGPVVFVANHPYGVLDGIVLSWLVEKIRSDFLVLTNAVLLRAPEVKDYVLAVDFSSTPEALKTNLDSRAKARDHLAAGGAVVVFPAGGVSTAPDRLGRLPAVDAQWQPFTAQLIQRAKATVVPVCFSGQNSRLFQIASHMSQTLRLSLIFHEVRNRMGTNLPVAIGEPIAFAEINHIKDRQDLVNHLMQRTYALGRADFAEISGGKRPDTGGTHFKPARSVLMRTWDKGRNALKQRLRAKTQPRPR